LRATYQATDGAARVRDGVDPAQAAG